MTTQRLAAKKQQIRNKWVRTLNHCRKLYHLSTALVMVTILVGPVGLWAQVHAGTAIMWPWVLYWVMVVTAVLVWMLRRHLLRMLEHQQDANIELAGEDEPDQDEDHVE